jgi:trehalose-6-phosphate synthase
VNPYDINQIADRLKCAVEMSATERAERMKVFENNLEYWSETFLSALASQEKLAHRADEDFEI